jgi:hypothetical protein
LNNSKSCQTIYYYFLIDKKENLRESCRYLKKQPTIQYWCWPPAPSMCKKEIFHKLHVVVAHVLQTAVLLIPLHQFVITAIIIKIIGVQSSNKCSLWNVERKEWAGLFA